MIPESLHAIFCFRTVDVFDIGFTSAIQFFKPILRLLGAKSNDFNTNL
jgi:hypothetical protein